MSGAVFDNVVGAIDGMLVWIRKPSKAECLREKCEKKTLNTTGRISLA